MLNYTNPDLNSADIRIKIAERLHFERTSLSLSLEALADKIGYSKPTVYSWERGWDPEDEKNRGKNRIPSLDQLIDLSALYNCTPEYLLCEYDCKTKVITDVSFQTGLLPENVTILINMFSRILQNPNGSGATNLFLSFLNHYVKNMDLINELIFNRMMLETQKQDFEEDPYHDILLRGYNAVCLHSVEIDIFKDSVFPDNVRSSQFTNQMIDFLTKEGYEDPVIVEIMKHFSTHFGAMSHNRFKQSDFALSDSFSDIVKGFFNEFPSNVYSDEGYDGFCDQHRKHVSPEDIISYSESIIKAGADLS